MIKFYSHRDEAGMAALFSGSYGMERVYEPQDADIIVYNGGEDICPRLYNEKPLPGCGPYNPSARDNEEIAIFDSFKDDPTKFFVGVCRGAQMLNVLNGGRLYQDVNGHNTSHAMMDLITGEVLAVTSTHHQQMRPGKTAEVIGVADCSTKKRSASDGVEDFTLSGYLKQGRDVEVVFYPEHRTLCIQGHPEYVPGSRFADYSLELINKYRVAA